MRTHVPFFEAPVTNPSNASPIRDWSRSAAAAFFTRRSTLCASSSISVQCLASSSIWAFEYGTGAPAMALLRRRWVRRSGNRRLGAVECV